MNAHDIRSIPAATIFETKANAGARPVHELNLVTWNKIAQLAKKLSAKLWGGDWHCTGHLRDT